MNEANKAVRDAARDLAVEILGGWSQPQEMESYFGEGSAGPRSNCVYAVCRGHFRKAKPKPPSGVTWR